MRVLSLSHTYPLPPDDGSRVRLWNMTSRLVERHDLRLVTTGARTSATPSTETISGSGAVEPSWIHARPAPRPGHGLGARIFRLVRGVAMGVPPWVLAETSRDASGEVRRLCLEGWPDVVVVEDNGGGELLGSVPREIPSVWVKYSLLAPDTKAFAAEMAQGSLRSNLDAWLTRRYERRITRRASLIVTLTDEDAAELRALYGDVSVVVVPNGVSLIGRGAPADPQLAAFVGNFEWYPNVDAVRWLVREIWPLVVARVPGARLRLIGKALTPRLAQELSGSGVEPIGYAPDLRKALERVGVGVVPVRVGGGIRCKLLDMLGAGIATVTTPLGGRGVPVQHGANALVASTTEGFADAIVSLMTDAGLRGAIERETARMADSLSWDGRVSMFEDALEGILRR